MRQMGPARLSGEKTASMTLTRVNERIDGLKELHRNNEWKRALDRYQELRRMLIDIRVRHPHLSDQQRTTIQGLVSRLRDMETEVDSYVMQFRLTPARCSTLV